MTTIMRTFKTKNFRVVASIEPEDQLDLSWDDTGEVREKLASGEYEAFCTKIAVYWNGAEIAADYLGESIYADPRDFFTEHVGLAAKSRADGCNYGCYFPDMIHTVIADARKHMANVPHVRKVA